MKHVTPVLPLVLPLVTLLVTLPGCGDAERDRAADARDAVELGADTLANPSDPDRVAYGHLRRTVCDTLTNSFDCARAIERRRLSAGAIATRDGDTLRLPLAGGDTARFVDQRGDHAEVALYSYQDRWSEVGFHVLQKQYYEGSEFLLVDDSTGARTRLPDWPLRSPDARRFAVLSLDLVAGYGPNTLQVWEIVEGEPVRQWETSPSQWGPTGGNWVDPETLELTQRGYCDQLGGTGREMCERPARLTLRAGSWHLEPGEVPDGG